MSGVGLGAPADRGRDREDGTCASRCGRSADGLGLPALRSGRPPSVQMQPHCLRHDYFPHGSPAWSLASPSPAPTLRGQHPLLPGKASITAEAGFSGKLMPPWKLPSLPTRTNEGPEPLHLAHPDLEDEVGRKYPLARGIVTQRVYQDNRLWIRDRPTVSY